MCQAKIRETRSFHLLPLGRNHLSSVRTPENFPSLCKNYRTTDATDKKGLGAGRHRQPGSAEVLLGSSLLEQHSTALVETPLQGGARLRIHAANSKLKTFYLLFRQN